MHNYYLPPAPGSYPWAPDWSPDGKSITISLLGSIWKVDPDTGDATQLTYDKIITLRPTGRRTASGSSTLPMTTIDGFNCAF